MALAELNQKRTRTTKHFLDLGTGKNVARLYTYDVHYQDEVGAWQETAETFEAGTIAGFARKADRMRHALHGADDGGRRWYPRRNVDEYVQLTGIQYRHTIGDWRVLPNLGTPTWDRGTAIWTRPNFSLKLAVNYHRVKFELKLNNSTVAKPIRVGVSLHGLTYDHQTGALTSTTDGIVAGWVDKPVAWDDRVNPNAPGFVPNIPVSATYSGGYITFTADLAGAVYPVTIDPTFTDGYGGDATTYKDAAIWHSTNEVSDTHNLGVSTAIGVGNVSIWTGRTLIQFDLSSIAAGSTITSATLSLTPITDNADNARTLRVFRLLRVWVEGTRNDVDDNPATGATWIRYDTTNNWQTAGGFGANDCEQTDIGSVAISATQTLNVAVDISLTTSAIAEMISGGGFTNNGFMLKVDTEFGDEFDYASSDHATTAYRPVLEVVYETGGGVAYLRNVNEIVDIAEATRRALALKRKQAETVNILEVQQKAATWLRLIAETVNLAEATRKLLALRRALAETLNILETNKAALALSRGIAETVNILEATGSAMSRLLTKLIAESVQLLETTKRTLTLTRGLAETVDISEAVHKAATWLRLVAETVQISEASNRAMTLARTVAETLHIAEATGRLGALVQRIAETLNISEAADSAFAQAQALVKWANETLHLREVVSIAKWPFGHLSVEIRRDYGRVQLIGRGYLASIVGRLYRVRNNQS